MKGLEIERKFLLKSLPSFLKEARGLPILQGYAAYDEHTEVRLRKNGRNHYITIKQGSGLQRKEFEEQISAQQFHSLWPATTGRRLEKIRSVIPYGSHRIEIDRYLGELSPLLVAEVEFRSVEESQAFSPPAYFGQEVTDHDGFRNASLALHGRPDESLPDYQIAALPYLFRSGKLHFVLVTNSTQTKWIIPKGCPEPDMPRQDVAAMEAVEEAGVIGSIPPGLHVQCRRKGEKTLHIYPLKVSTLLKKWPEMSWRKRDVLPAAKAIKALSDPALSSCIERIAARLVA